MPVVTNREWNTGVATGLLRLVVGAVLLRWRRPLAQHLAGAGPDDKLLPLIFGYFGLRDMTVGAMTLAATRPDGDIPKQVTQQGLADTTDALLIGAVMSRGYISRPRGVAGIVLAGGTAVGEFATAIQLRRSR